MIIYSHYNTITQKRYIGQTKYSAERRLLSHIKAAIRGSQYDFHKAIVELPLNSWVTEILEENIQTQDVLNEREIYWIDYFDSYKNGYNHTKGGVHGWDYVNENNKGEHHWLYGKQQSPETRRKISEALKGKPMPQHRKEKISKSLKGRPCSDATRKKISDKLKGRVSPTKGMKQTQESIQKRINSRKKGRRRACKN